jgi:hypothetical protein
LIIQNDKDMTNEQKIQSEFSALLELGKKEANQIVNESVKLAQNSVNVNRKRPTLLKYTIEDVTPFGYGN